MSGLGLLPCKPTHEPHSAGSKSLLINGVDGRAIGLARKTFNHQPYIALG